MSENTLSRPIVATLHLKKGGHAPTSRRYSKIDKALPRSTQRLMWLGSPGDVIEFSHALTGMALGFIKVKAGGRLESQFVWEE